MPVSDHWLAVALSWTLRKAIQVVGLCCYRVHVFFFPAAARSVRDLCGQYMLHLTSTRDAAAFSVGTILRFGDTHAQREIFIKTYGLPLNHALISSSLLSRFMQAYADVCSVSEVWCYAKDHSLFRTKRERTSHVQAVLCLYAEDRPRLRRSRISTRSWKLVQASGRALPEIDAALVVRFLEVYNDVVNAHGSIETALFLHVLRKTMKRHFLGQERAAIDFLLSCPKILIEPLRALPLPTSRQSIVSQKTVLPCTFANAAVLVLSPFADGLWLDLRESGHVSNATHLLRITTALHALAAGKARVVGISADSVSGGIDVFPSHRTSFVNAFVWLLYRLFDRGEAEKKPSRHLIYRQIITEQLFPHARVKTRYNASFSAGYALSVALKTGVRSLGIPVTYSFGGCERLEVLRLHMREYCSPAAVSRALSEAVPPDHLVPRHIHELQQALRNVLVGKNAILGEMLFAAYADPIGILAWSLERVLGWQPRVAADILSDFVFSNIYPCRSGYVMSGIESINGGSDLYDLMYGAGSGLSSLLGEQIQFLFDPSQISLSKRSHSKLSIGVGPRLSSADPVVDGATMVSLVAPQKSRARDIVGVDRKKCEGDDSQAMYLLDIEAHEEREAAIAFARWARSVLEFPTELPSLGHV